MQLTQSLVVETAATTGGASGPQIRREGPRAAAWFEVHGGLEPAAIASARESFIESLRAEGTVHGDDSRQHWNWVANKLQAASETLMARIPATRAETTRTRVLEGVVPNSKLDLAINSVVGLATTTTRGYAVRSEIGQWLMFLSERGTDPGRAGLVELELFRRWLSEPAANGKPRRKTPKQVLVPARKLIRLLRSSED
jgi:hypothetical protein